MKTREQLYGKEAAGLLRDISSYHCIRREQVYRLYPDKDKAVMDNLLFYLTKQRRIFYDQPADIFCDSPDLEVDREMLAALWVLADFADRRNTIPPMISRQKSSFLQTAKPMKLSVSRRIRRR